MALLQMNWSKVCQTATTGLLCWSLLGCSSDPKTTALQDGVNLMDSIVHSQVLMDAVRNADPQMKASTAAGAAISGGVTANFPLPPEDIAIASQGKAEQPWSVVIFGDDERQEVHIEGYGNDLQKPVIVEIIKFPP